MLKLHLSSRFCHLAILALLCCLPSPFAFVLSPSSTLKTLPTQRLLHLAAVTEAQVLAAVEEAEALWAKALEARKNADEAAGKAEAARAAASNNDEEQSNGDAAHETSHLNPKVLTLASLADNMEADEFIEQAEEFSQEADDIEAQADKALAETEKLLEQHLKDFPESPLADEE